MTGACGSPAAPACWSSTHRRASTRAGRRRPPSGSGSAGASCSGARRCGPSLPDCRCTEAGLSYPGVTTASDPIAAGTEALQRGAWEDARTHFQASLAAGETPGALEHLGLAAWWLDDAALTLDARERSFRLYRETGDPLGAARVAVWLAWDYLAFRGDAAVAAGWLERARRLLAGHESTSEYGWLLLRDGEVALFRGHDPTTARDHAVRAA